VELYLPNGTHEERERVRTTRARSGVDGAYEFDGLIPHLDYTVVASHGAYPLGWVFHVAVAGTTAVNGVTVELPRGGSIRGRVVDETGSVIEGASVRLEESGPGEEAKLARWRDWRLAASGEDGSYEIDRLREGRTYSLEASAPGFLPERSFSEEVEAGAATGAPDIALSRPQSMSGRVVDASGRPVPGASVNYESTDADGRFTLHNLEWTFEVRVESPGFEERTVPVATTAREVVIVLERLATLAGEVRGPAAAPLNGLRLRVAGGDGRKLETRGAGGTASWPFELAVPAGVYYVHAEAEGLARGRSAEVAVAAGERRGGIVIELEPEAIVAGKVVARATGRPVDGAADTLQAAAAAGGRLGAMTDGAGTFELRGVPEGDVVLDVEPGAYADGTTRLAAATMPAGSVRAGERKEVAIELDPFPTGGIRGVVLEGGRPPAAAWIGKATVSLTTRGQEFLRLGVDGAGRFGIDGLEAGRYGIVVSALYDEERPDDGGRFFAQGNVNVTAGRIATARIEAGPPVEVAGRVSAGGVPASGLHLEAVDAERAFGLPDRSHGPFAWRSPPRVRTPGASTGSASTAGRGTRSWCAARVAGGASASWRCLRWEGPFASTSTFRRSSARGW
jgi:hypothetical protein